VQSWEWTGAMRNRIRNGSRVSRGVLAAGAGIVLIASQLAAADARDQVKRIFDRIAGVPPTETQIQQMLAEPSFVDAALNVATEAPTFYSVTLKNFVTPWTNRDQTVFAPLNDYTATVIGMVRDNLPFNEVLSADLLYTVNASGLPAASPTSNDHYAEAERRGIDLKAALVRTTQSRVYGIPSEATAGVVTTRAAAEAFFIDGTNRAMFRFTLLNHLCRDLEQLQDITRPPDRIRQDVSRSPGADSRVFLNNCIGCHSGMDPMAQAYAYYDFDETLGRLVYTPGIVNAKYFNNADTFKPGFVTPDDSWENRWRAGPNVILGWGNTPGSGAGAKSLGMELAGSHAFAQCQVEKVFKAVCFRSPGNEADRTAVATITGRFKNGYNLRRVFAETADYCKGDE
jgi:hypothetical protein